MKDLKEILEASISSNKLDESSILADVEDTLSLSDNDLRKEAIKKFIKDNYEHSYTVGPAYKISNKPNKDGKFEVSSKSGLIRINRKSRNKLTSITNGDFVWTKVDGGFDISWMPNLETLEGMPKEIGGALWMNQCPNVRSLDGFPEKVGTKDKGSMIYIARTGTPKYFSKADVMKVCKEPADGFIDAGDGDWVKIK